VSEVAGVNAESDAETLEADLIVPAESTRCANRRSGFALSHVSVSCGAGELATGELIVARIESLSSAGGQ
jgi:hypothetical protein